ncbi:hypothetical protein ACFFQW_44960 [Umezawaea endophytica]|uniref:Repeat protein (TIGR01451 family) n=1 Tax=Umezawaea endophytica TaxID=1654476 RepID=A0A9X2VNT9_9PSEU|nr:hypothetical protein [Umezawaea endophytica]MCS7479951.1 hypothetical protein [Umezawaea endophytica]
MPAVGVALVALVGCSAAVPASIAVSASSSSAAPTSSSVPVETPQAVVEKPVVEQPVVEQPVVEQPRCAVDPADVAVPPADPYTTLPARYGVQVAIAGVPDLVEVGKPVEVEVTLCNNSPVAYPEVGVVFGMARCTCAGEPSQISRGTAQRFDAASGAWVELDHPALGTGMDHLSLYSNRQPLAKGQTVSVRYRFTLDRSMGEGEGGVVATAVMANGPTKISEGSASFAVRH